MRTSFADDRYISDEQDLIVGGFATELGEQPRGIIYAHGSGGTAENQLPDMGLMFREWSRRATVHAGDLGFQTWGSDLVVTRIGQAITYLQSIGVQTPVALVGTSMGGCSVLNYAYQHPENVSCVAALIPLTDLVSIRANPWLSLRWPEIDAIYGEPPNEDYTGHNPVDFASSMDADLPIKIWYSDDDPLVYPATVEAFHSARPQTEMVNMGSHGHDVPNSYAESILEFIDLYLEPR